MGAYVFHHAVVQHDDDVRVLHGGDPLGDDELGGVREFPAGTPDGSWRRCAVSTAEVESSRIRILGFFSSARAMHSRCF